MNCNIYLWLWLEMQLPTPHHTTPPPPQGLTLARKDLPVPGGPYSSTPAQGLRSSSKKVGNMRGRMTASFRAALATSSPTTLSHCTQQHRGTKQGTSNWSFVESWQQLDDALSLRRLQAGSLGQRYMCTHMENGMLTDRGGLPCMQPYKSLTLMAPSCACIICLH